MPPTSSYPKQCMTLRAELNCRMLRLFRMPKQLSTSSSVAVLATTKRGYTEFSSKAFPCGSDLLWGSIGLPTKPSHRTSWPDKQKSLRPLQAGMNRTAHCDDEKTYVRSRTSPKSRCNDSASHNVYLSSSDSETDTGENAKALFTLNTEMSQSSTILT